MAAGATPARAAKCPAAPNPIDVAEQPSVELTEPVNVGEVRRQAVNYKCFGQYDKDVATVLSNAKQYIETYVDHLEDKPHDKPLTIVLDIDETSLSNWPAMEADDFGYIRKGPCTLAPDEGCGWYAWRAMGKDAPIEPTLELFKAARAKSVAVFFVTGRYDIDAARADTERNLREAGYDGWADILMCSQACKDYDTVAKFKAPARAEIEKKYIIIANVGDQWSDLTGGHAEMSFKVPNPFYFIK